MHWYKQIKTADAKNKIKRLGIDDPYEQAFIYKYENIIPWQGVTDHQGFQDTLNSLVAKQKARIDEAPGEHRVSLHSWVQFAAFWGNGTNNAIVFMFLKPMIDYANSHRTLPAPAPFAISKVVDKIKSDPFAQMSVMREYLNSMSEIPKEDGWHPFVANYDDYESEALKLSTFVQGSGWCISTPEIAEDYLGDADGEGPCNFYIYVENGRPEVALVSNWEYSEFDDEDEPIGEQEEVFSEIEGRFNQVPALKYLDAVLKKMEKEDLSYEHSTSIKNMIGAKGINDRLDSNQAEFPGIMQRDYMSLLSNSGSHIFLLLSPEAQANTDIIAWTEEYLFGYLSGSLNSYNQIRSEVKGLISDERLAEALNEYSKRAIVGSVSVPPAVLNIIPEGALNLIDADLLTQGWIKCLPHSMVKISEIPDIVVDMADPTELATAIFDGDPFLTKTKMSDLSEKVKAIVTSPDFKEITKESRAKAVKRNPHVLSSISDPEEKKQLMKEYYAVLKEYVDAKVNASLNEFKIRFVNPLCSYKTDEERMAEFEIKINRSRAGSLYLFVPEGFREYSADRIKSHTKINKYLALALDINPALFRINEF